MIVHQQVGVYAVLEGRVPPPISQHGSVWPHLLEVHIQAGERFVIIHEGSHVAQAVNRVHFRTTRWPASNSHPMVARWASSQKATRCSRVIFFP